MIRQTFTFAPDFRTVATVSAVAPITALAEETGVYSATPEFMRLHCGPIVHGILDAIPASWFAECARLGLHPNGDVRIHRLYPGDFPAYPGWHCDGEYRETYFSQPDLDKIPLSRHLCCVVSSHDGGVSSPEFLDAPLTVEIDPAGWIDMRATAEQHNLWAQVDRAVGRDWPAVAIRDGDVTEFGCRAIHRVRPATMRGWRLFFRLSMWHRPNLGDGGKISRQEQVYKVLEGTGW